jgi:hypothetical protein
MAFSHSLGTVALILLCRIVAQGMESWLPHPVLEFHQKCCLALLMFFPIAMILVLMANG